MNALDGDGGAWALLSLLIPCTAPIIIALPEWIKQLTHFDQLFSNAT